VQERSVARHGVAPTPRPRSLPPEAEGEALDLQATVAALADRRRGRSWDARLFRRTVPPVRASVLVLLDLSQSTLAPWGAGPLTVQAAQQQAALWLARRLTEHGARVAVHGFASNGRSEVAYWRAVEFGAPCDAAALAALPVRHSTRLGAALRHAQAILGEEPSGRRTVVLVTDGQPWDIDVFDAGHLLQDARRAMDGLRAAGMRAQCIACDARAVAELQPVFGTAGLFLLDAPATMARGLADARRAILAR
jgi:nitric oxide reductase activation protein